MKFTNSIRLALGALLVAMVVTSCIKEESISNKEREQVSLKALLPAALEAEFAKTFEASAKELLAAGVEVGYSKEVKSGFKVGEKDGGYYISFTDESFEALLDEYLREKVSQLLFA